MNIQPQVEELEDRSVSSVADLAAFQQQLLPSLETQFHAFVSNVQSNLQTDLNHLQALTPSFPAPLQPLLNGFFAQEQQFVNAFPVLANARFLETVAKIEMQLLASSPPAAAPLAVLSPGFFYPFFPGYFGYPGVLPYGYGYGYGYGGGAFTSAFTGGSSGFSSGSVGSASPAVAGQGKGMGVGIMSVAGALTLPQSNHP